MDNNIISLSVAGGGKTTQLINRVNELLSKGVKKEEILIISFTNSTVDNIKERVRLALENSSGMGNEEVNCTTFSKEMSSNLPRNEEVNCYTIHGFLYSLMPNNYNIIDSHENLVKLFIKSYSQLLRLGIYQVTRMVDAFFINANPIDMALLNEKDYLLNEQLLSLIEDIQEEKRTMNMLSFSEIIHEALKNKLNILSDIDTRFNHFLLDEAQDLSKVQLEFVYYMIEYCFTQKYKSFFIVGDPKQSIYDFQDSCEEYYLLFIEKIEELCKKHNINLTKQIYNKTYRFGGNILSSVNNLDYITAHESEIEEGNVYKIEKIQEVLEKIKKEGAMIIYHYANRFVTKLQNDLCNHGYNINLWVRNENLFNCLQDIFNYSMTGELWYRVRILQGCFFHIPEPRLQFLHKENRLGTYNQKWFKKIETLHNPSELIEFLALNVYLDDYEKMVLQRIYELSFAYDSLGALLLDLPDKIHLTNSNSIEFSTIHSAKGLEKDNVIYINNPRKPRSKIFINLNPFFCTYNKDFYGLKEKDNYNNRHYVAITRAKKNLYILDCL